MKNLFETTTVEGIKQRLEQLRPDSHPLWGKMNVAQMVAHCAAGLEMATGKLRPPRAFIGRMMGSIVKPMVLRDEEPMRRNSLTLKELVVPDDRNFRAERERLRELIDRFAAAGPEGCTTHPHSFFGKLTAQEWAILMYKHLDHHLRQFGV